MAIDFSFSPEHEAVRETIRRFCRAELAPLVRQAEEDEVFPRQLFRQWGQLGLIGVRYPEADGGASSAWTRTVEPSYLARRPSAKGWA